MKHSFNLLYVLLAALVVSCTATSKYEPLIKEYAQTNKSGVFTDLSYKTVSIEEQAPITVSDSLAILKEEFEKNKKDDQQRFEQSLKRAKDGLAKEEKSRFKSKSLINTYTELLNESQKRLDKVNAQQFEHFYEKESPDKVLLIPVKCRYSYVFPPGNPRQERTDIFYFTPDGKKIVGQKHVSNLE